MKTEIRLRVIFIGMIVSTFSFSALFPFPANAYSWDECSGHKIEWNSGWTNMYISTTSFPPGSSWDVRLQNAMWHWNNVKGSYFSFYYGRDTDGTHRSGNGVNEVYLDNDMSGPLAVTRVRYHCYWFFGWHYGIDETDIGFNNNVSWSTGTLNYNNLSSPFSFEGVALHELGHALGLHHEDRWMATMNSFYPNSGTLGHWREWDPLADDREGARYLYPDAATESDIAGSVFKRTGSGSSGLVSSPSSGTRSSTVSIGYTFSNLSTSTKSFNIGFYLSTDSYISTADILLGTNGAWASAGYTGTFTRSLFIPTTISGGNYYIGFIVDYDEALGESNESNNYMEMPATITITVPKLPDLVVDSLPHWPRNPTVLDTITFTAIVKNIGGSTATSSTLNFRVGGETFGKDFAIPALSPGQSFTVQRMEVLGVAQRYRNTVTADSKNAVVEANEGNNQKTSDYTVSSN